MSYRKVDIHLNEPCKIHSLVIVFAFISMMAMCWSVGGLEFIEQEHTTHQEGE